MSEPDAASANLASNPERDARAIRIVTAVGGSLVGIVVGATAGYQLFPHDCGCDDPGLAELVYGGLAGTVLGGALGAAIPRLGSVCSFGERIGRSFLGSTAGAALGLVAAAGLSTGEATLITVPLFSAAGALGALGRCWKMKPAQPDG